MGDVASRAQDASSSSSSSSSSKTPAGAAAAFHSNAGFGGGGGVGSAGRHLTILDFQNVDVGEAVGDVAYLMILELSPADRRLHEERLVRIHWDLLVDEGGLDTNEVPFEWYESVSVRARVCIVRRFIPAGLRVNAYGLGVYLVL